MISTNRTLVRNSLFNSLRYAVNFGIGFVLTPILIKHLGDATYGLWMLVLSLVGFAGLLEMGINAAVTKLTAQYRAEGKLDVVDDIASSAMQFFIVLGIIVLALCALAGPKYVIHVVSDASFDLHTASLLSLLIGVDALIVFISNVITGILFGAHRFEIKGIVDVVIRIVLFIFTIVLLRMGYGVIGLISLKIFLDFLTVIIMFPFCRRLCPEIKLQVWKFRKKALAQLFTFGSKIFGLVIMVRIYNSTNPVIISTFLGTSWNAFYSVATRLSTITVEILLAFTAAFMPMFSDLGARNDDNALQEIYLNFSRYIIMISVPIYVGVMMLGPDFLEVWVGSEYKAKAGMTLVLVTASQLFNNLLPLWNRYAVGSGHIKYHARVVIISFVALIAAAIPCVIYGGIEALAAVELLRSVIATLLLMRYQSVHPGIPLRKFVGKCYFPLIPGLSVFVFALYCLGYYVDSPGYINILLRGALAMALCLMVSWTVMLTKQERHQVTDRLGHQCRVFFHKS